MLTLPNCPDVPASTEAQPQAIWFVRRLRRYAGAVDVIAPHRYRRACSPDDATVIVAAPADLPGLDYLLAAYPGRLIVLWDQRNVLAPFDLLPRDTGADVALIADPSVDGLLEQLDDLTGAADACRGVD